MADGQAVSGIMWDRLEDHTGMMARENGQAWHRMGPSKLEELRQAIDGLVLLVGWQQELLGRARALLPKATPPKPHRRRRMGRQP